MPAGICNYPLPCETSAMGPQSKAPFALNYCASIACVVGITLYSVASGAASNITARDTLTIPRTTLKNVRAFLCSPAELIVAAIQISAPFS